MYLLLFVQGCAETPVALFESIESGRQFAKRIPGYKIWEEIEDDYYAEYETLNPALLPDYIEIEYNGNAIPITRFMFREHSTVDLIWREIPNMEKPKQGLIDGQTLVDAYVIPNAELKQYITKRELVYTTVQSALKKLGYDAERNFYGSQDGEALVYKKHTEYEWHFLTHIDPEFVNNTPLDEYEVENLLKELL